MKIAREENWHGDTELTADERALITSMGLYA
jgi:hypothetical protein